MVISACNIPGDCTRYASVVSYASAYTKKPYSQEGKFIMDATKSAEPVGLLSVQKDVQDFIRAAEKLLSPVLRTSLDFR